MASNQVMRKRERMSESTPQQEGAAGQWHQWGAALASVAAHGLGVALVAVGSLWLFLGLGHMESILAMHREGGNWTLAFPQAPIHVVLSALVWGCGVQVWKVISGGMGASQRLMTSRGTVITETLIVMPVLLLIILGISQLAVNNIANMLFNYGSSQSARAAWVGYPELAPIDGGPSRMGVSSDRVEDMARLQLAAAMTPVAPSEFASDRDIESPAFERMRALLLSHQHPTPAPDSGSAGLETAAGLDVFSAADELSFTRALDGSAFPHRTVRKFTSAYQAVEVELVDEGNEVGVDIVYHHQITFPLMGRVFGEHGRVNGAPGHFMQLDAEILYPTQVAPNAELPQP